MKVMFHRSAGAIAAAAGLCIATAAVGQNQNTYTTYEQRQYTTMSNQIDGTIDTILVRELKGDRVVLALVDTQDSFTLVNLGPVQEIRQFSNQLSEGQRIRVTLKPSSDPTTVVVAETLDIDGQTIDLTTTGATYQETWETRQFSSGGGQQLTGTVHTVRTFDIDGEEHLVVWVNTPRGVQAIDLGIADEVMHLRNQLQQGMRIVADATPRQVEGYTIHSVETVQVNGQPLQISSSRSFASNESFQMQSQSSGQIRGTVQTITHRSLHGERHLVAQVRTNEGRTVTVDLGPASQAQSIQTRIQEGQQISFSGHQQNLGGQTIYMTQQVNVNGQPIHITSARDQSQSQWRTQQDQSQFDRMRQDRFGTNERFEDDRFEQDRFRDDRFQDDRFNQRDDFDRDQPPYGRAEGFRRNRGLDPLEGPPGRRVGQQREQWDPRQQNEQTRRDQWNRDPSWHRDQNWGPREQQGWQRDQTQGWERNQTWQNQNRDQDWQRSQQQNRQWDRDQSSQNQWQRNQNWGTQDQQSWQRDQTQRWDRNQDQSWNRQQQNRGQQQGQWDDNYWQRDRSMQQDDMQQRRLEQQRQMQQRQREMEERERQRERERQQRQSDTRPNR